MAISKEKQVLLNKIKEYEEKELFDVDVNDDPSTIELLPEKVDYLCKKKSSKLKRKIANFIADRYFLNLIKKDILIIDGIENEHLLEDALKNYYQEDWSELEEEQEVGSTIICHCFSVTEQQIIDAILNNNAKTFDDVSEQGEIKVILENQIKTENIKHAYLFCGGAGTR